MDPRRALPLLLLTVCVVGAVSAHGNGLDGQSLVRRVRRINLSEYLVPPPPPPKFHSAIRTGRLAQPPTAEEPGYFAQFMSWLNPFSYGGSPSPHPEAPYPPKFIQPVPPPSPGGPPAKMYDDPSPPAYDRPPLPPLPPRISDYHPEYPPPVRAKNCNPCDKIPWVPMQYGELSHSRDASFVAPSQPQSHQIPSSNGVYLPPSGGVAHDAHHAASQETFIGPLPNPYSGPIPPLFKMADFHYPIQADGTLEGSSGYLGAPPPSESGFHAENESFAKHGGFNGARNEQSAYADASALSGVGTVRQGSGYVNSGTGNGEFPHLDVQGQRVHGDLSSSGTQVSHTNPVLGQRGYEDIAAPQGSFNAIHHQTSIDSSGGGGGLDHQTSNSGQFYEINESLSGEPLDNSNRINQDRPPSSYGISDLGRAPSNYEHRHNDDLSSSGSAVKGSRAPPLRPDGTSATIENLIHVEESPLLDLTRKGESRTDSSPIPPTSNAFVDPSKSGEIAATTLAPRDELYDALLQGVTDRSPPIDSYITRKTTTRMTTTPRIPDAETLLSSDQMIYLQSDSSSNTRGTTTKKPSTKRPTTKKMSTQRMTTQRMTTRTTIIPFRQWNTLVKFYDGTDEDTPDRSPPIDSLGTTDDSQGSIPDAGTLLSSDQMIEPRPTPPYPTSTTSKSKPPQKQGPWYQWSTLVKFYDGTDEDTPDQNVADRSPPIDSLRTTDETQVSSADTGTLLSSGQMANPRPTPPSPTKTMRKNEEPCCQWSTPGKFYDGTDEDTPDRSPPIDSLGTTDETQGSTPDTETLLSSGQMVNLRPSTTTTTTKRYGGPFHQWSTLVKFHDGTDEDTPDQNVADHSPPIDSLRTTDETQVSSADTGTLLSSGPMIYLRPTPSTTTTTKRYRPFPDPDHLSTLVKFYDGTDEDTPDQNVNVNSEEQEEGELSARQQGAKRNKQVQVIIPYTSQYTPFPFHSSHEQKYGRKDSHASESNHDNYVSEESRKQIKVDNLPDGSHTFQTWPTTATILEHVISNSTKVTTTKTNRKTDNSIDVHRLQKNIDNWTIQEYSKGTTVSTMSPSSVNPYLFPSKQIPDEYLTTTESSVSHVDAPHDDNVKTFTLAGFSFNDLDNEGSASSRVEGSRVQAVRNEDSKSNENPDDAATKSDITWQGFSVDISPVNKERVYVVTPQSTSESRLEQKKEKTTKEAKKNPKESNETDTKKTRTKSKTFESIEKAYQVLPQAVNNLAVASTGPESVPLWGIMEHEEFASLNESEQDNEDNESPDVPVLYAGHSKVSHARR